MARNTRVGVVGAAEINVTPPPADRSGKFPDFSEPATWSTLWFAAAVLFLLAVFFGFGGFRGRVVG